MKEVIQQISHSKKWASNTPVLDEQGQPVLKANGKPQYRKSYSVLQDQMHEYLTEKGFQDIERGIPGSSAEHLTSLEYQIKKDNDRLAEISKRIEMEKISYKDNHKNFMTYSEIDNLGQKKLGGKYSLSQEDYKSLAELAKEGISSRSVIQNQRNAISRLRSDNNKLRNQVERLTDKLMEMKELCKPYLDAMERFPEKVNDFFKSLSLTKEKAITEKEKTQGVLSHGHASPKRKRERELSR